MNYRVIAKWETAEGNRTVDVPNVLGDVTPTPVSGTAVFKLNGQEFRLTDLSEDPKTSLFFVFSDFTSKTETYPGGRFLDAEPPANGTVVLDFNRAYNPPCSVTPYATCPLAPKENRLALAILWAKSTITKAVITKLPAELLIRSAKEASNCPRRYNKNRRKRPNLKLRVVL